jgi:hypothetical protein
VEDQPILYPMRVGEFVDQPRLAYSGLADDGDNLAVARTSLTQDAAQMLYFGVAADKAREASKSRGLQPRARLTFAASLRSGQSNPLP